MRPCTHVRSGLSINLEVGNCNFGLGPQLAVLGPLLMDADVEF